METLSGGEFSLFTAALVTAMVGLRSAEMRLLLVEAGELDTNNLVGIMDGIQAHTENLTCALVMSCHEPVIVDTAWNLMKVPSEQVAA